jgi:hypothetical protein
MADFITDFIIDFIIDSSLPQDLTHKADAGELHRRPWVERRGR